MNILDTSFEENSFIINGYTLEYKTDENGTPEWKYATNKKTNKPNYPYYVGVKNKTGVHVPTNTVKGISPFEMSNPKLSDLFGLHVYNKPFGFQDMQIIPSTNNYPYYGNDVNKHGLYYSYDGLVTGYVLNGVGEEDIKLTNGNKELKVHTINEDDITNSETKRVIYTPKDNNDVLPYGPYYKFTTYFYGVNGSAEYSPSGKTTFYYKYTENNEDTYIQIHPQDVKWGEHNNEYYIFVKATKENNLGVDGYQRISKYVDAGVDGIIQIYDENGMIYYIKQKDSQGNEIYVRSDSISSYQYAVVSNENNTLHLTDGYGEDVEINLNEGYDRLYPTDIILDNNILKINKEQVDYYDEFYLFKKPTSTLVSVVEDVYKMLDTQNTISDLINEITVTSDEVNYKINIVVHKTVFNIINNKHFIEYTYKLDDNTFNVIDRELNGNGYNLSISCNGLPYDKSLDNDNDNETKFHNFLDVIIGENIGTNKDYKINEVDGGIEVSIVIDNTDSNNNIILNGNVNLGNITNIGGKILAPDYVYNRVDKIVYEKTSITQKKEVFILDKEDIDNNPDVYITLDVGTIVCIGTLNKPEDEPENKYLIVIDQNKTEIEINGLVYTYKIQKDGVNVENIEYYHYNEINYFPETPQLLLNIFYGDYVGYDNEIPISNVDDKDLYYIYDISGNIDYVFMLCKKTIDNVIYYSYSPKICCNTLELKINSEEATDITPDIQDNVIDGNAGFWLNGFEIESKPFKIENINDKSTVSWNIPIKFQKNSQDLILYHPGAYFLVNATITNGKKDYITKNYVYVFLPDLKYGGDYVFPVFNELDKYGEVFVNRYNIENVNTTEDSYIIFGKIINSLDLFIKDNLKLKLKIHQCFINTEEHSFIIDANNSEGYNLPFIMDVSINYTTEVKNYILNVSKSQYLSNYNFTYERIGFNESNEEFIIESQSVSPENIDNIEIKYNPINEKVNIYDCTGLKIINTKIKNETEEN